MTRPRQHGGMAHTGPNIKLIARARRRKFLGSHRRELAYLLGMVLTLVLAVNAAVALWIGFQDLIWPVSLSAQFSGLFLFLAGLASLAGLFGVFPLTRMVVSLTGRDNAGPNTLGSIAIVIRETSSRSLALVASAALAGLYIDLIIAFYSLHNKTILAFTFIILATFCTCLACVTIPAIWKDLSNGLKAAGIVLTTLGAAAHFWYQSVYAPENVQVGMIYTIAIGSVAQSGSEKLIQVNLTMEDAGSIPEVALGSMMVVSGISYPSGQTTVLRVMQPIGNDSYFFPNDSFSNDFIVTAKPGTDALSIHLVVYVALTTKLALDQPGIQEGIRNCPLGTQSEWYISQSSLRRFTDGTQVLWSDWCPSSVSPYTEVGIAGIRGGRLVSVPSIYSYSVRNTSRYDTLLLG